MDNALSPLATDNPLRSEKSRTRRLHLTTASPKGSTALAGLHPSSKYKKQHKEPSLEEAMQLVDLLHPRQVLPNGDTVPWPICSSSTGLFCGTDDENSLYWLISAIFCCGYRTSSDFARYGAGLSVLWKFYKWGFTVFAIWTLLSIPVFVLASAGTGAVTQGAGESVELDSVSVGNLGDERNVTSVLIPFCDGTPEQCSMDKSQVAQVVVAMDLLATLLFLMAACWMRACVQLEEVQSTGGFLSARDYTLKVESLPPDATEWELRAHFEQLARREGQEAREHKALQEARSRSPCCGPVETPEVAPGPKDEGKVAEVFLAEDCEELFEVCMLRGTLIKRLDNAWAAVDQRVGQLEAEHGAYPGKLPRSRKEADARLHELERKRDLIKAKVVEATTRAKAVRPTSGVLAAFITFERAEDAARVLRAYGNGDTARWCCLPSDLRLTRESKLGIGAIRSAKKAAMGARMRRAARAISSLYQASARLRVPEGRPEQGGVVGVEEWLEDGGMQADLDFGANGGDGETSSEDAEAGASKGAGAGLSSPGVARGSVASREGKEETGSGGSGRADVARAQLEGDHGLTAAALDAAGAFQQAGASAADKRRQGTAGKGGGAQGAKETAENSDSDRDTGAVELDEVGVDAGLAAVAPIPLHSPTGHRGSVPREASLGTGLVSAPGSKGPESDEPASMLVTRASEPSTIQWQNIGYSPCARCCLQSVTSLVALVVVLASSALTFWASIEQEQAQNEGGERDCPVDAETGEPIAVAREQAEADPEMLHCYCRLIPAQELLSDPEEKAMCEGWLGAQSLALTIVILAAFATVAVNGALEICLWKLAKWERHHSLEARSLSFGSRLTLFQIVNTAYMATLVNAYIPGLDWGGLGIKDFTSTWYAEVGSQMVISLFVQILVMNGYDWLTLVWAYCCVRTSGNIKAARTQREMDALFTGSGFKFETRYAELINITYVCLAFSTGMPVMHVVAAAAFFVTFWSDKALFLRHFRTPPFQDATLHKHLTAWLPLAVLAHLAVGAWQLSNRTIFSSDEWVEEQFGQDLRIAEGQDQARESAEELAKQLQGLPPELEADKNVLTVTERLSQPHVVPMVVLFVVVALGMVLEWAAGSLCRCCCQVCAFATCGLCSGDRDDPIAAALLSAAQSDLLAMRADQEDAQKAGKGKDKVDENDGTYGGRRLEVHDVLPSFSQAQTNGWLHGLTSYNPLDNPRVQDLMGMDREHGRRSRRVWELKSFSASKRSFVLPPPPPPPKAGGTGGAPPPPPSAAAAAAASGPAPSPPAGDASSSVPPAEEV